MNVNVKLNSAASELKRMGLDQGGRAQAFHTRNVANRITKYEPYKINGSIPKSTLSGVDVQHSEIVIRGPSVRYLNMGKVMVGSGKGNKRATEKNLQYTKRVNHLAGPYWAQRLCTAEGRALREDLQRFLKGGGI